MHSFACTQLVPSYSRLGGMLLVALFVSLLVHRQRAISVLSCASECRVILYSTHSEVRVEPTQCDICEGREIIYMTLPLIGAEILI